MTMARHGGRLRISDNLMERVEPSSLMVVACMFPVGRIRAVQACKLKQSDQTLGLRRGGTRLITRIPNATHCNVRHPSTTHSRL
jgi:hypothetical protein